MNEQQKHEMILERSYPTGADEWYCPVCGRRMLINWEPEFKRTLLQAGEDDAIHSVSKGSLPIGSLQAETADDSQPDHEDSRLGPWLTWLEKIDFESLWDDEA